MNLNGEKKNNSKIEKIEKINDDNNKNLNIINPKFDKYISSQLILRKYLQKTEKSLIRMLIKEIQKEKIPDKQLSKENNINKIEIINPSLRNIPLMLGIMKKIFSFQKFIYINRINDYHLNNILNNFQYIHIPKNKFIFNKNDSVDYFYLIIQGKVSIESLNNEKNDYEKKYTILNDGDCFGELELIDNKIIRISSSFSLENCDLLYLSKEKFNTYLLKIMRRNHQFQKNFIYESIPPFSKSNFLEIIDRTLDKIVLKKNDILYFEGQPAEYLYIIYDGEFAVKRNIIYKKDYNFLSETDNNKINLNQSNTHFINLKNINNKSKQKNINLNKNDYEYYLKLPILLNLSKGEFIGLESIKNYELYYKKYKEIEKKIQKENDNNKINDIFNNFFEKQNPRNIFFNNKIIRNDKSNRYYHNYSLDFNEKEKKKNIKIILDIENKYNYNSTLIAKKDFNLVYRLKPKLIAHNIYGVLNKFFKNIIKHRDSIIDIYYKNYNELSNEIKIIYREELINNKILEEKGRLRKIKINKLLSPKKLKEKKPNFNKTFISQFILNKSNCYSRNYSYSQKINKENISIKNLKKYFPNDINNSDKNLIKKKLNNSMFKIIYSNREKKSNSKRNFNHSSDLIFSLNQSLNYSQRILKTKKNNLFNSGNYILPLCSTIIPKNEI